MKEEKILRNKSILALIISLITLTTVVSYASDKTLTRNYFSNLKMISNHTYGFHYSLVESKILQKKTFNPFPSYVLPPVSEVLKKLESGAGIKEVSSNAFADFKFLCQLNHQIDLYSTSIRNEKRFGEIIYVVAHNHKRKEYSILFCYMPEKVHSLMFQVTEDKRHLLLYSTAIENPKNFSAAQLKAYMGIYQILPNQRFIKLKAFYPGLINNIDFSLKKLGVFESKGFFKIKPALFMDYHANRLIMNILDPGNMVIETISVFLP